MRFREHLLVVVAELELGERRLAGALDIGGLTRLSRTHAHPHQSVTMRPDGPDDGEIPIIIFFVMPLLTSHTRQSG